MRVGVVDIGTNSMRLLIADEDGEAERLVEVTGLGRGVDRTGRLSEEAMTRSLAALERFGRLMDRRGVDRRAAIATSASRDSANRDDFFDRVEAALGVRPILVSGDEEGQLAYAGATSGVEYQHPVVVSDIGGGSTEFVTEDTAVSIDIGSVRLTERVIPSRPPDPSQLPAARDLVAESFAGVRGGAGTLIGVGGTWTSLGAMARSLDGYSGGVDDDVMSRADLDRVTALLLGKTVEETAAIPALDPNRAPVILGGALIAQGVMDVVGIGDVVISERDSLDGMAMRLLA